MDTRIYSDIALRTQGDIYIGVVGPVRSGKSTFIKRFMEKLVVPNIDDRFKKERTVDELPQSAAGRTIMTTEPKFIPNEAVEVNMADNARFRVRMIDCVGYIVPSALGYIEEDIPRMVSTPWFEQDIPFNMAAEMGTKKVITEHSTIGLVITTDGTIGEIPREEYIDAEERVIGELRDINKPFVVLLNCETPQSEEAMALRAELEEKYRVPVMAVNCMDLDEPDIKQILENILFEFPVREISVNLPAWVDALEDDYWLKRSLYGAICETARNIEKIREITPAIAWLNSNEHVTAASVQTIDLGRGSAEVEIRTESGLFFTVLRETSGLEIHDEGELITVVQSLSRAKREYDKVAFALNEAANKGYGIVTPGIEELSLEEPEIVRQGGKYGVKLKASAPSIHMIRADIETEVLPFKMKVKAQHRKGVALKAEAYQFQYIGR